MKLKNVSIWDVISLTLIANAIIVLVGANVLMVIDKTGIVPVTFDQVIEMIRGSQGYEGFLVFWLIGLIFLGPVLSVVKIVSTLRRK